jgi:hypothetical protein
LLIHTPNPHYTTDYTSQLIRSPDDPGYNMPIILVDPRSMRPEDEELLLALSQHAPRTKFRPGDIAMLDGHVPKKLVVTHERIPRMWEVRFVVSRWAMEAMLTVHSKLDVRGLDHLYEIIRSHGGLPEQAYRNPVIYAHGYPHGIYPNTAAWLSEWNLKKLAIRDPVIGWHEIVEESGAPFFGYDTSGLVAPFQFEVAPDKYSGGHNLQHPFMHEEPGVQTLCTMGLEEHLFDPIIVGRERRIKKIDRDHEIFNTQEST